MVKINNLFFPFKCNFELSMNSLGLRLFVYHRLGLHISVKYFSVALTEFLFAPSIILVGLFISSAVVVLLLVLLGFTIPHRDNFTCKQFF